MKTFIARFLTAKGTTQRMIHADLKENARGQAAVIAKVEGSQVSSVRTYWGNTTGRKNP